MMRYLNRMSNILILMGSILLVLFFAGCGKKEIVHGEPLTPLRLTSIEEIDSFDPEQACHQALEVINQNPYSEAFFEKGFARVVDRCKNHKASTNADIIWNHLVMPLRQSGKVPPDLAKITWNRYFSRQFVSLPDMGPITHYCNSLADIKKDLEKEYRLKKAGFEVCMQGSVEPHFLNAMYVYNTMWAACQPAP